MVYSDFANFIEFLITQVIKNSNCIWIRFLIFGIKYAKWYNTVASYRYTWYPNVQKKFSKNWKYIYVRLQNDMCSVLYSEWWHT